MARESAITFEQVATAADTIKAKGGKATSRAVREILGTGSMATILRFLQQWGGGQARPSQAIDDTLDVSVVRSISAHIADKVQTATAAATAQLADQQAEMDNLIIENERQAAELEALTTAYASLQEQCNQLSGVVQQLEADAARTAKELASERQATETARIQLAKAELRLEAVPRIENEIIQVRDELAKSQKKVAELHETAAVATAKLEAATSQRKEIDTHVAELKAALKEVQTQFAAEQQKNKTLTSEQATTLAKLEAAILQRQEIDTHVAELKATLRDNQARLAADQEKNKTIATDHAAALAAQVTATHAAEKRAAATEATTAAQVTQIKELQATIEKLHKPVQPKPARTKPQKTDA